MVSGNRAWLSGSRPRLWTRSADRAGLIEEGLTVHGIDASPTLIAAFRERFPNAIAKCEAIEDSNFFGRTFDAVISSGMMFLLSPDTQSAVIRKIANVLNSGGRFLFTSPREAVNWTDKLTGRKSVSLGLARYREMLQGSGLLLVGEQIDEGANHYYLVSKTKQQMQDKINESQGI
jgi:SAM-dependent methyltransferase